jgi:hypothetical protein
MSGLVSSEPFRQSVAVNRLFFLLLVMASVPPALAADSGSKLSALVKETQKIHSDADTFRLAWWIPYQYWEENFKNNPRMTDAQKQDFLNTLRDYTVMAVVDAKKGGLAVFTYVAADEILKTAKLTVPDGTTFSALLESDLSPGARNLISMMKPFFANILGQFGQNTVFVVFPAKGADGDKLIDPYQEGHFSFVENGHSFSWRLPLGSLLPDETCPKCGEVLPGNYKFCPYDGTKLESVAVPEKSPGS